MWEDARTWAHWNHFIDIHLCSLRPAFCVFSSWVSSGCTARGACRGCLLDGLVMDSPIVSILFSHSYHQGSCDKVAWWLQHPLFNVMASRMLVLTVFCNYLFAYDASFRLRPDRGSPWLLLALAKFCHKIDNRYFLVETNWVAYITENESLVFICPVNLIWCDHASGPLYTVKSCVWYYYHHTLDYTENS